jgi:hypothetical protein
MGAAISVFVVWQPMLPTDWGRPIASVLGRLGDSRARQFWDKDHLVAKRLAADARAPQPMPDCCEDWGIPWDLVAVYAKGTLWTDRLPPAVLFNGPVIQVEESLQSTVSELASK